VIAESGPSHEHELSFGGVRFVRVFGEPEIARLFVVVRDGTALCTVADAGAAPLHLTVCEIGMMPRATWD